MAFIFADSFDHYADADKTAKWTQYNSTPTTTSSDTTIASVGARSTSGLRLRCINNSAFSSGWLAIVPATPVPSGATIVAGFRFRSVTAFANFVSNQTSSDATSSGVQCMVQFRSGGTTQIWMRLNVNGTVSVLRGTTVLGTTSAALTQNTWQFVEVKVVLDGSAGTVVVKFDNTSVLSLTSQNTRNAGVSTWDEMRIGAMGVPATGGTAAAEWNYDDLYLLDGSGGSHDDFYGDVRIDWHPVTGAGNSTMFTPSAGSNYQNVDDTTPDGDTTTNTATAVSDKDTFTLTDLIPAGGTIKVVQAALYAKKSAAGTCTIAPVIRHSGSDYDGTAVGPSTSYAFQLQGYTQNPGTSAAWTESGFNGIELGYKQVT